MTKPFTTPFAADAPDNLFIPETAQPDGSVSYETGFGPDYSKDPLENGAKPVPRKGHNELFFQITGSIGDIQRQGAADWYLEFAADGGYPKNAIVWLDGDRWKSQIDGNTTRPNIDEIAWLPSAKFEGGGGGGGGDFGLTGPTTIAVGGSFQYKISPYSSFMTYAVSATNGTATISGDTITLAIAPGETANVTDLTVIRSDGVRNDFRIAIGAQSIAKPSILSPASGSIDVPLGPLLTASAFATYPAGADTHLNTDWRIRTMAGAVVWQSLENAVNKTNIQVPDNTLPLNTQLQVDVRYRGTTLPASEWSTPVPFTTTNQSITTPTITAPLNGATGIGATPTFTAAAFATNPPGADTHASSDWQLKNSLGAVIWSSIANTANKTSITLPTGVLDVSSQYTMEVRYNGNVLQPSQWSPVVSFTTSAAFSYERYLAAGSRTRPFALIYGQDVDTFVKLPNPATMPNNSATGIAFSPNGLYCAVTFLSAPFLTVYKRTGDSFVKIAGPAFLPSGGAYSVSFSGDSKYLALGASSSPGRLIVYEINNDVFSATPSIPEPPALGLVKGVAFSSNYLAAAVSSGGPAIIYQRTGNTFDRVSVGTLPTSVDSNGVAFSPDGVYLAIAQERSPYVTIAKRRSYYFSALADPETLPNSACNGVAFSPDGVYLAVATTSYPYVIIYKKSGDTFVKLANPSTLPASKGNAVAFSSDGLYLSVAHNVTPCLTTYKRTGDSFVKLADPAAPPTTESSAVAVYPPVLGR